MRNRRGVSLIEVLVALVLFGLIATVHTVATMRYGLGQRVAALGAARSAALATAVDLISTMPRANLAGAVGCATINDNPRFVYTRCITSAAVNGTMTRFTITITPANPDLQAMEVNVDRVTGAAAPPIT